MYRTTRRYLLWIFREGYIFDWALALFLIFFSLVIVVDYIKPHERIYLVDDPQLSFPHTDGTVPSWALFLLVVPIPIIIFAVFQVRKRSLEDWHHSSLALVEAFALTVTFKRGLNLVGRLRPDWLARVAEDEVGNGRLSYPSGHSAYSFSSMTVLSWYLIGKWGLLSANSQGHFAKTVVALVPVGVAAFIAATRLVDYRHDFADVNAGSFIGLVCGSLAYFLNYGSPFAETCGDPKLRGRRVIDYEGARKPDRTALTSTEEEEGQEVEEND